MPQFAVPLAATPFGFGGSAALAPDCLPRLGAAARLAGMVAAPVALNPFLPGDGQLPPKLSGREAEQSVLLGCLDRLKAGRPCPSNVILIGPRGNGKTALLRWFKRRCEKAKGVDTVWLTPKAVPGRDALASRLGPKRRFLPASVSVNLGGLAGGEWRLADDPGAFAELLVARCKRRPLVVLLDEAHALDAEVGGFLLNLSQEVRGEDAPFLLVLAGTPGLQDALNQMGASFWDRAEQLGVGRLSAGASAEALEVPLAREGVSLDPGALADVVADSQRYPYFIQLWGEALWNALRREGGKRVDASLAAAAQPAVSKTRGNYYENRRHEINESGLANCAVAVAEAFRFRAQLPEAALEAAVRQGGGDRYTLRALQALGYVWRPLGQAGPIHHEPGIPSLMDYILSEHEAHRRINRAPGAAATNQISNRAVTFQRTEAI